MFSVLNVFPKVFEGFKMVQKRLKKGLKIVFRIRNVSKCFRYVLSHFLEWCIRDFKDCEKSRKGFETVFKNEHKNVRNAKIDKLSEDVLKHVTCLTKSA